MNNDICIIGETNFRNQKHKFGIKTDDRRRHIYIIGKTGMGKSVLLENMIYQDIMAGRGVCYVDPHGDTVEKLLDYIPSERIKDVVYFNPADTDYPVAFNVFEKVDPKYKHLVASGLVGVFKKLWADSWGPRLEYLLRNSILALLDKPDSTLLDVNRMYTDKEFRKKVLQHVKDPVVKTFWVDEFSRYPDKFATEAVAPIQNKVGQFLSVSLIRNIVGQVKSSIDIRKIMDEQKIFLVNLSKGRIGEDNSAMLGAMIITKIQLAAMSRVDILEKERKDFYLYVDEFQNFATESFATILSEARKYRLCLIVAHQYIEQLGDTVKAAIFGNVGTMITFRVGAADAEFLVKEFEPYFTEQDIINLPKYHIYLKLMIDGVASQPFSASTLPPLAVPTGNTEAVIEFSRKNYTTLLNVVENRILKWSGLDEDTITQKEQEIEYKEEKKLLKELEKQGIKTRETFQTNCWLCDKLIDVPFKPDGSRPVYCRQCLSKPKEEREKELAQKQQSLNNNLNKNKQNNNRKEHTQEKNVVNKENKQSENSNKIEDKNSNKNNIDNITNKKKEKHQKGLTTINKINNKSDNKNHPKIISVKTNQNLKYHKKEGSFTQENISKKNKQNFDKKIIDIRKTTPVMKKVDDKTLSLSSLLSKDDKKNHQKTKNILDSKSNFYQDKDKNQGDPKHQGPTTLSPGQVVKL